MTFQGFSNKNVIITFMQKKKFSLLIALAPILFFFFPFLAHAQSNWDASCVGTGEAEDVATLAGIGCIISNVLSVVFSILTFGGFIMLVISGIKLMLSGSDAQGTRKAAASIRNVIIGLVLALGSFLIVQLISSFTGIQSILTLQLGD